MDDKKEKYEKPVLISIELRAEEVLGFGCNKPDSSAAVFESGKNCTFSTCTGLGQS